MAALGPLWAGMTYDHVMTGSPYWIGALIIGIACLVLMQAKVKAVRNNQVGAVSPAD